MKVLQDIASDLNLKNVKIVVSRAEAFQQKFDCMLGRAVSAIPNFLSFSAHLLKESINDDSNGLYYLKGGEYSSELQAAQIENYSITELSSLAPGVQPDKSILYIPAREINAFRKRQPVA